MKRIKGREPERHIIPLSDAPVELLREQKAKRWPKQPYVFPGEKPREPLSPPALGRKLRQMATSYCAWRTAEDR
jgi:integrase